jgi:imidazolonepropionase-like amidohydrolase
VGASTPQEIDAVVETVVKGNELRLVLLGAEYADTRADLLSGSNVVVLLRPGQTVRRDNDELHLPTLLSNAGVDVAFQSEAEDGARNLSAVALFALQQGMSPDAVMRALTSVPARAFGINDRVGTIEAGLDGDLVIFDGHPLDAATRVRGVLINGQEVQP